jgi:hypothetical protein
MSKPRDLYLRLGIKFIPQFSDIGFISIHLNTQYQIHGISLGRESVKGYTNQSLRQILDDQQNDLPPVPNQHPLPAPTPTHSVMDRFIMHTPASHPPQPIPILQ